MSYTLQLLGEIETRLSLITKKTTCEDGDFSALTEMLVELHNSTTSEERGAAECVDLVAEIVAEMKRYDVIQPSEQVELISTFEDLVDSDAEHNHYENDYLREAIIDVLFHTTVTPSEPMIDWAASVAARNKDGLIAAKIKRLLIEWIDGAQAAPVTPVAHVVAKTTPKPNNMTCYRGNPPEENIAIDVVLPLAIYMQIVELCHLAGRNEVGWFGTMNFIDGHVYVDEIFLPKQSVSPATVDITGIGALAQELVAAGRLDDVNRLHFWGHCHPGSSVTPSGTDIATYNELIENSDSLLMGIFSRDGRRAYFRLHHHGLNIMLNWRVDVNLASPASSLADQFNDNVLQSRSHYTGKRSAKTDDDDDTPLLVTRRPYRQRK